MSVRFMSTYMCEVWRPPPLPYHTEVDLKDFYADDEAYKNYTRLCPGYGYLDGPDINTSKTVASAGLEVIIPIVIGLVVVVIIVSFVVWRCYAKQHRSSTLPFSAYKDTNYLDNKAIKGIRWQGMKSITRHSLIETSVTNSNSNGADKQVQVPSTEGATTAVYSKGQRENAATGESNRSRERHGRKKSKRASENGGGKVRDETASMKRKSCDKVERTLTPVENVEDIDGILNKVYHNSANDVSRTSPDLSAYDVLNSNKNSVNTPPSLNIYDVLRNSEGGNANRLPPLDSQSVKHRNSDPQVILEKKKKKKGLLRKSAPVPYTP